MKLLLLAGRILIVFDGLDELIETKDRLTVRSAVEHFALEYPVAPIVVTSREVGYEQAPLDRTQFAHFKLSPFGEKQVVEYAAKWFQYSCSPNVEEGKRLAESFVDDSAIVPDIRSNPLMLGLLCNLYRQDGFIPKNRPEIYQRCADLLFTKWDRGRGINIKLPLDHRLRPAMSYLANWIYSDEDLQVGVTESQLVAKTSSYLRRWVEDDSEADQIARDFVAFFSGRAWVFTDTGSNKTQRLYQFTHRTFLEFFTADELVRLNPQAEDLHNSLISRIRGREWDVVCQLAYQLSVQRILSNDAFVELLCEEIKGSDVRERLNVASFLARTMDLLYPTPRARREAVGLCVRSVFSNLETIQDAGDDLVGPALEVFAGVFGTGMETRKINSSEILKSLISIINDDDQPKEQKVLSLLLMEDLSIVLRMSSDREFEKEDIFFWEDQSEKLRKEIRDVRRSLARADFRLAIDQWWHKEDDSKLLNQRFGPAVFFQAVDYPLGNWFRTPIARAVIEVGFESPPERAEEGSARSEMSTYGDFVQWVSDQGRMLGVLLVGASPWEPLGQTSFLLDPTQQFVRAHQKGRLAWNENKDLVASAFVCLAIVAELKIPEKIRLPEDSGMLGKLMAFIYSHREEAFRAASHAMLELECVDQDIRTVLHEWVDGRRSFVLQMVK